MGNKKYRYIHLVHRTLFKDLFATPLNLERQDLQSAKVKSRFSALQFVFGLENWSHFSGDVKSIFPGGARYVH